MCELHPDSQRHKASESNRVLSERISRRLTRSRRHYCHISWQSAAYPEWHGAPAALPKQATGRFPGIFSGMHGGQTRRGPRMSGLCQRHSRLSSRWLRLLPPFFVGSDGRPSKRHEKGETGWLPLFAGAVAGQPPSVSISSPWALCGLLRAERRRW